jgi:hypothetical protein
MADDRRKLTHLDIIADQKLLKMADIIGDRPAKGSRSSAAPVIRYLPNDGLDCAIDVSLCGDRGLFLLH